MSESEKYEVLEKIGELCMCMRQIATTTNMFQDMVPLV